MARGGHGLPKVSHGPAMPDSSMPCGRAIPEKALRPYIFFPFRHCMPYAYVLITLFVPSGSHLAVVQPNTAASPFSPIILSPVTVIEMETLDNDLGDLTENGQ
jgi:hypothetical protein